MKLHISFILVLFCAVYAYADIAPNPIQKKGIVAGQNQSIRMKSETVVVDIYKDRAVVQCTIYMKNDSAAHTLTIGFPDMNFYYYRGNNATNVDRFFESENGEQKDVKYDFKFWRGTGPIKP